MNQTKNIHVGIVSLVNFLSEKMKNRITIETDDLALIEQIRLLVKDAQGLTVTLDTFSISETALKIMNRIAESGGTNSISDPVAWQKETRKDRSIPFRN